jgi:hypothetical protein
MIESAVMGVAAAIAKRFNFPPLLSLAAAHSEP